MKRSSLIGLAAACLLVLAMPVRAQVEPAATTKEQDIRRLLDLTGSRALAEQVLDQMISIFQQQQQQQQSPAVVEEFWKQFRSEIDTQGLLDEMIPIYDKHFSQEEIRGLIAFYETPLGAKLIEKLPAIAQESMAAGQAWGQEVAQKIVAKLQAQQKKAQP